MTPYFHVGIVVTDLGAAMSELSQAVGLTWEKPHHSQYGDWEIDVVFSIEGPPYMELIQGSPGGPWSTSGGPHIDHLGYASEDPDGDGTRLLGAGFDIDFDPTSVGSRPAFCYYRGRHTGARVEILGASVLQHLLARHHH